MSTYKGIRGLTIRTVAGDPSPLAVGDIWYNDALKKVRGAKNVGAWASGGNLNSAKEAGASSKNGTQTAYLAISGRTPPNSVNDFVESYDGSSWTEVADVDSPRQSSGGMGTQTAGLIVGGYNGSAYVGDSEEWNGTSWAEGNNANDAIGYRGTTGTQTAGLAVGGSSPTQAETEEYDGTSWTEVTDYPAAKYGIGAAGTQTAAIFYGGSPVVASSFTYDGSSYSPVSALNTARFYVTGDGDCYNHDDAFNGISDERVKQDITDASSQWDDIKALKIRSFRKKDDVRAYGDDAKTQIGVIAQEALLVSPKLVTEVKPTPADVQSSSEFGTLYEDGDTIPDDKEIGDVKEVKDHVKGFKYSILFI